MHARAGRDGAGSWTAESVTGGMAEEAPDTCKDLTAVVVAAEKPDVAEAHRSTGAAFCIRARGYRASATWLTWVNARVRYATQLCWHGITNAPWMEAAACRSNPRLRFTE